MLVSNQTSFILIVLSISRQSSTQGTNTVKRKLLNVLPYTWNIIFNRSFGSLVPPGTESNQISRFKSDNAFMHPDWVNFRMARAEFCLNEQV